MAVLSGEDQSAASLAAEKTIEDSSTSRAEESNDDEKQQRTSDAVEPAAEPAAEPEAPPRDIEGWKWYVTLVSILASTFLYALDATVVADLQAIIVSELGGIQKLSWLSVAFLLCATATNLVWGRLYGHLNAKWFYIFHVTIFEIGSAICGAAPSINVMILGRAIAGIGGSGLYVGCMTLLATTTTIEERPLYISCTGFTWGLGIVLGPVIGGAFSESAVGWRWAFYINLFIGAACAPFYLFLIPSKDPQPGASVKERTSDLDYPGIVLQGAALTAIILAVNMGGVTYPWDSGRIIALFVVAGVLFIALGIQQVWTIGTTVARRIIPVQFFRSRTVLLLFGASASSGACAFVPIYMVPLFFQFTRSDGALMAGVRLLPFVIVMIVFVFVNGALMAKLGYYMPWYLVGGLLTVAGSALMYTVEQDTSESRVYGYTVIIGAGVGMFLQAAFSVAQAVVDVENVAPAIGFITLAQFVGITLALAIANAVLLNESEDRIMQILPNVPLGDIQAAILGARSGIVKNLSPDLKAQVLDAIVSAMDKTYILVLAGGALVAVSSLLMRREKLFGAAAGINAA
ncbi:Major facilitator superfamily domain general substrate transporter [Penicillium alfredii]|uniref:Major facilitator superfamily domain general substrate transporter n=1 Tax=Penicillium alfredii TaxID=1506179 RepID=A0A9W9FA06_9EURO|nr:Major facilitator superfamily domain general substrate transporter [Penicillium alfredii]KAJ5096378.1 Major facilitator superfamily domain general substrate transporter [Penicillium alfredii]